MQKGISHWSIAICNIYYDINQKHDYTHSGAWMLTMTMYKVETAFLSNLVEVFTFEWNRPVWPTGAYPQRKYRMCQVFDSFEAGVKTMSAIANSIKETHSEWQDKKWPYFECELSGHFFLSVFTLVTDRVLAELDRRHSSRQNDQEWFSVFFFLKHWPLLLPKISTRWHRGYRGNFKET